MVPPLQSALTLTHPPTSPQIPYNPGKKELARALFAHDDFLHNPARAFTEVLAFLEARLLRDPGKGRGKGGCFVGWFWGCWTMCVYIGGGPVAVIRRATPIHKC